MAVRSKVTEALERQPAFREGYVLAQGNIAIGSYIRTLRQGRGWTQMQLASAVGVSQPDISRLEDGRWGRGGINLQILDRVLHAFGVRVTHSLRPEAGVSHSRDEQRIFDEMEKLLLRDGAT